MILQMVIKFSHMEYFKHDTKYILFLPLLRAPNKQCDWLKYQSNSMCKEQMCVSLWLY